VRVFYFASAAHAAGVLEESWNAGDEMDLEEFWNEAIRLHPRLSPLRDSCRISVNHAYANSSERIPANAEVAVLPPVSGG